MRKTPGQLAYERITRLGDLLVELDKSLAFSEKRPSPRANRQFLRPYEVICLGGASFLHSSSNASREQS